MVSTPQLTHSQLYELQHSFDSNKANAHFGPRLDEVTGGSKLRNCVLSLVRDLLGFVVLQLLGHVALLVNTLCVVLECSRECMLQAAATQLTTLPVYMIKPPGSVYYCFGKWGT